MIATRPERKIAHLAGTEIQRYFTALLRERARSDGSDAVSTLARHATQGDRISMIEACDMLMVLMIAGNETTTNLIGNGMRALLRHPRQMQRLREEPDRVRSAIDEMLRYDSPVQTDFRIAKAEIDLRGRTIKPGDGVILLTGSANRDETAFEHADRFDITRTGPRHLSFGFGVHHCIGAELARMEASAIFTEALSKLAKIELAESKTYYRKSTVIRGLAALPLKVEGRQAASSVRDYRRVVLHGEVDRPGDIAQCSRTLMQSAGPGRVTPRGDRDPRPERHLRKLARTVA